MKSTAPPQQRGIELSFVWSVTSSLEFASSRLVIQAFRDRLSAGAGLLSWFLLAQCILNQYLQASQCVVSVFLLASKLLRLQDDDALAADALVMLLKQLVANTVRQ